MVGGERWAADLHAGVVHSLVQRQRPPGAVTAAAVGRALAGRALASGGGGEPAELAGRGVKVKVKKKKQ